MTVRDEVLFGRPPKLKVFISSEMRSRDLEQERLAAADAVEEVGIHFAWYWERDSNAGPFSSEVVCLGQARTSDCLILILGATLTPITRSEYFEAQSAGASCFIFAKVGCTRDSDAEEFLQLERRHAITKNFETPGDLRSVIIAALMAHAVQATRRGQLAKTAANAERRSRSPLAWIRGGSRG